MEGIIACKCAVIEVAAWKVVMYGILHVKYKDDLQLFVHRNM